MTPAVSVAESVPRSSAELGETLRAIVVAPGDGFASALHRVRRRAGAGQKPAEGVAPLVLSLLGGVSVMTLWLKLGALADLRRVAVPGPRWAYLAGALLFGGLLALVALGLWGMVGGLVARAMGAPVSASSMRAAAGLSALPQALAVALLLPLDLLMAPEGVMGGQVLSGGGRGWTVVSTTVAISLTVWSLGLFAAGHREATGGGAGKGTLLTVVSLVMLAALAAASIIGAGALARL